MDLLSWQRGLKWFTLNPLRHVIKLCSFLKPFIYLYNFFLINLYSYFIYTFWYIHFSNLKFQNKTIDKFPLHTSSSNKINGLLSEYTAIYEYNISPYLRTKTWFLWWLSIRLIFLKWTLLHGFMSKTFTLIYVLIVK